MSSDANPFSTAYKGDFMLQEGGVHHTHRLFYLSGTGNWWKDARKTSSTGAAKKFRPRMSRITCSCIRGYERPQLSPCPIASSANEHAHSSLLETARRSSFARLSLSWTSNREVKKRHPDVEIAIFEHPPNASFGFGVVFSDRTLEFLGGRPDRSCTCNLSSHGARALVRMFTLNP